MKTLDKRSDRSKVGLAEFFTTHLGDIRLVLNGPDGVEKFSLRPPQPYSLYLFQPGGPAYSRDPEDLNIHGPKVAGFPNDDPLKIVVFNDAYLDLIQRIVTEYEAYNTEVEITVEQADYPEE